MLLGLFSHAQFSASTELQLNTYAFGWTNLCTASPCIKFIPSSWSHL